MIPSYWEPHCPPEIRSCQCPLEKNLGKRVEKLPVTEKAGHSQSPTPLLREGCRVTALGWARGGTERSLCPLLGPGRLPAARGMEVGSR